MLPEEVQAGTLGPEENQLNFGGSVIGHILHERFLVEDDLTDWSLGGWFSVFLVRDLKKYCRDAVLRVSRSLPDDLEAGGPSLKEVADVLAQIRHQNIEEVLETGHLADGRPFALTAPYPATSLDRLIASGKRLELEGIAQLVEQIAEALSAAHSKGILHCDLRPSNILVPPGDIGAGSIKITNFGAAWPIDVRGESLDRVPPGSEPLYYAAPELLVKLGHRSRCSDIYSLAVLVYRLATGSLPYAAQDRAGLLEMINAGSAKPPADARTDLSDEAAALIMAGLQFEPLWRPQNVEDFGLRLVWSLSPPKGIVPAPVQESAEIKEEPIPEQVEVKPQPQLRLEEKHPGRVRIKSADTRAPVSERTVAWSLITLLMAGALSIPIGQMLFKKESSAATIETIVNRPAENRRHRLKVWFDPWKQSDPPPGGNSLSEQGGQLGFVSDTAGEAYVFSEFTADDARPAYRVIFPSPDSENVTGRTEAEKPVRIARPELAGPRPPKAIWIVWTAGQNGDLESIRSSAKDGAVSDDEERRRLRHFLERNRNLWVKASVDDLTGQTILDGTGESMVYRIDLSEGGQ